MVKDLGKIGGEREVLGKLKQSEPIQKVVIVMVNKRRKLRLSGR